MIRQTLDAVFENGVFRPLEPRQVPVSEGQAVRLTVEAFDTAEEALELATRVYDGLSEQEIDEIEQLALNRGDWFGERPSE